MFILLKIIVKVISCKYEIWLSIIVFRMWVNETILVSAVTLFVKVRSVDPYLMDAKGGQQLNSHGPHSPNRTS